MTHAIFWNVFQAIFPQTTHFRGLTNGNSQAKINVNVQKLIDKLKDIGKGGFNIRQKK